MRPIMEIKVVRDRFDELLKVFAISNLSLAARRVLWVAALEALDKAVAEGRVTAAGHVVSCENLAGMQFGGRSTGTGR